MAPDLYTAVDETDAFLEPVRYGAVDEVIGHAAVRAYHPPPRQVRLILRGHRVADDTWRGAEELGDVAVRDDATGRYDTYHHRDIAAQAHRGSAPIASATACQASSEAADSSTPCGSPGAYVVPSRSRATAPSSVIMSDAAAWSQGFGRR